jgi:hypothetical protein
MKQIPIIAPSRVELVAFLEANPWLNAGAVVEIREASDLDGHTGLVLALPGWQCSPSIRDPRGMLASIAERPMQLVVLENADYKLAERVVGFGDQWVCGGDPLGAI